MNFEQSGPLIATIKNKEPKEKKDKIDVNIYNDYDNKDNLKTYFEELELTNPDEYFQIMPNKKSRACGYITGSSGSGKSWYVKQYIIEYHKLLPKNKIYVLSSLKSDDSLDSLKYIKRLKLDDKFLNADITIEDFKDTLVIADDTDVIKNKYVRDKVYNIIDQILEIGRHHNISLLITNHLATNGTDTKRAINEAHFVVIFPMTISSRAKRYLLGEYLGLSKEQLKELNTLKSRAITIIRAYPKLILSEKKIYVLKNDL